jgi:hypothetical protein
VSPRVKVAAVACVALLIGALLFWARPLVSYEIRQDEKTWTENPFDDYEVYVCNYLGRAKPVERLDTECPLFWPRQIAPRRDER